MQDDAVLFRPTCTALRFQPSSLSVLTIRRRQTLPILPVAIGVAADHDFSPVSCHPQVLICDFDGIIHAASYLGNAHADRDGMAYDACADLPLDPRGNSAGTVLRRVGQHDHELVIFPPGNGIGGTEVVHQ